MADTKTLTQELSKLQGKQFDLAMAFIANLLKDKQSTAQVSRKVPKQQNKEQSNRESATVAKKHKTSSVSQNIDESLVSSSQSENNRIAEPDPQKNNKPQEELLYGIKEGKPFLNMSVEDAIAVSAIMDAREGITVPNAENLIVRSADGKTLFEADEQGKVIFNIYEREPSLIGDRDFQKSSGLSGLQTAIGFVKQSEQIAQASRESVSRRQKVERTLSKIAQNVPATSLDSPKGKEINNSRGNVSSPQLSREAAILATFYDKSGLGKSQEFGSVTINGTDFHKGAMSNNGFTLQMRNDNGDLVLLGTYSQQTGWSVSPKFAGSEAESLLVKDLQSRNLMPSLEQSPNMHLENGSEPVLNSEAIELDKPKSVTLPETVKSSITEPALDSNLIEVEEPESVVTSGIAESSINEPELSHKSSESEIPELFAEPSQINFPSHQKVESRIEGEGAFEVLAENDAGELEPVSSYSPENGWTSNPNANESEPIVTSENATIYYGYQSYGEWLEPNHSAESGQEIEAITPDLIVQPDMNFELDEDLEMAS